MKVVCDNINVFVFMQVWSMNIIVSDFFIYFLFAFWSMYLVVTHSLTTLLTFLCHIFWT